MSSATAKTSSGASADLILSLEQKRRDAMIAEDREALECLLSNDLIHTHTNGQTDTKRVFLGNLGKRVRFLSFVPIAQSLVMREQAAILSGELIVTVQIAGQDAPLKMQNKILSVWTLEGAEWRQVAYQATKIT